MGNGFHMLKKNLEKLLHTCEKVYVVGFSMGGMIASYLAVHFPVEKLVLLSAAAYYVNPKQLAVDIGIMVKDLHKGKLSENELFIRYKRKLKETPFTATLQFRKLVNTIRPLSLKLVFLPLLHRVRLMELSLQKQHNICIIIFVLHLRNSFI